jgi:methylmalonyl-CoA/ethylmalonyl-CoA epimerase
MANINHIGIAVKHIEEAIRPYVEGLGLVLERTEVVSAQGVQVGFLPVGASELEFLEPLNADSPVAQFLEKCGEGVHHLCIEVDDLVATMARLRAQGSRLLSEAPIAGAGGSLVAFVHPRSTNGVLLELAQKKETRHG